MLNLNRRSVALFMAIAAMACGDDSTTNPPVSHESATIEGRVQETAPAAAPAGVEGPTRAAAAAQTVAAVAYASDGSVSALATADVEADGSFRIESVPANREDLAVVAYAGSEAVGRVLVHGRTEAGTVLKVAPINHETTVEGRAYARLKAMGEAEASSDSELALYVHMNDPEAETVLSSETEIQAVADGFTTAMKTMDDVHAKVGASIDAATRATLITEAAVDFAAEVDAGTPVDMAHETFMESALDAFIEAGATAESSVMATAGAATSFDAQVNGSSSVRGSLIYEAVHLNLGARERLAAEFESSSEATLAASIRSAISATRDDLGTSSTAAEIRGVLESERTALVDVMGSGMVDLLVPGASILLQSEIRSRAEAALEVASLAARLESTTTPEAVADAMASYRADVRTEVEAMIQASGDTDADVEVLTSLYMAAGGSAYIH